MRCPVLRALFKRLRMSGPHAYVTIYPYLLTAMLLSGCSAPSQSTAPTQASTSSSTGVEEVENAVEFEWHEVAFDDLVPDDLSVDMVQSWNAMGMDDHGRVYIGFTSVRDGGSSEDFVVFRYDPATDEREYLATFQDIAAASDNLEEGENIPKGHTRMIWADGVMYMGSQGFHDFKQGIDELPNYRGSHLFAYDTDQDSWVDVSRRLPGGVVTAQQGIVALNIMRDEELLVGLTHPHSDLVFYDYKADRMDRVVPGIPWRLGNPLSREMIVAPSGNIYTYRGTEELSRRDEVHPVWVYNIYTQEMKETAFTMTNGFWIGQTETRDGSTIYVSTTNGQLYEFDVATETFADLGHMLTNEDYASGRRVRFQYGLVLSPDETKIYFIPSEIENPQGSGELYEFDIATGEVTFVQQLPVGIYTSGDVRDDEHIYFAHFGNEGNLWSGDVRLMAIEIPQSP
jgi:outer membrane protein assembly factor BamB